MSDRDLLQALGRLFAGGLLLITGIGLALSEGASQVAVGVMVAIFGLMILDLGWPRP